MPPPAGRPVAHPMEMIKYTRLGELLSMQPVGRSALES